MDVRCDKCDTAYDLKEGQASETGVEIHCQRCGHRFRIRRRPAVVTREMAGLPAVSSQLGIKTPNENDKDSKLKDRPWYLRLRRTDEVLRFRDLSVLSQWIMDQRVTRDDDLSRGGRVWRRLGSIVELEALFYNAEKAHRARRQGGLSQSSGQLPSQKMFSQQSPQGPRSDLSGVAVGPLVPPPAGLHGGGQGTVPPLRGPGGQLAPSRSEGGPVANLSSTGRTMRPPLQPLGATTSAAVGQVPESHPHAPAPASSAKPPAGRPSRRRSSLAKGHPAATGPSAPRPPQSAQERSEPRASSEAASVMLVPDPGSGLPQESTTEITIQAGPPTVGATASPVCLPALDEMLRRSDPVPRFLKEPLGQEPSEGLPPTSAPAWLPDADRALCAPHPASKPSADEEHANEEELFRPKGSRPAWLPAALVLTAACAFAGMYLLMRQPPPGAAAGGIQGRGAAAYERGLRHLRADTEEDFQRAHDEFLRAAGADEGNPAPLAALAELHACWSVALGLDARHGTPQEAALLQRDAERHRKLARHYGNQALAMGPASAQLNRAMALVLTESGAPADQVEVYLREAHRGPGVDPDLAFVRARLSQREGRLDEARAWLEQASSAQPPLLRALMVRAALEAEAGDRPAAEKALSRVLALHPEHPRARQALAALGSPRPAAPDLGPPTPPPPSRPTEQVVQPSGPDGGAEPEEARPRDVASQLRRAQRLLERGRVREAARLFQQLADAHPDEPDVHVGLGRCALEMERYQAAAEHHRNALRLSPDYPPALIGLAEVYKMRGDTEQALRWYQRYLEHNPNGELATVARNNVARLQGMAGAATPDVAPPGPPPSQTGSPQ
ncbi:MAG: tetratricopeptide repeat protein [Myxococcales bacterium]|nr:zinc-ribbon domain-containing protein [Myxococcota bacterium]MDW8281607.1 tetratricopeptide repeat protein [Myxococcales bacterium]